MEVHVTGTITASVPAPVERNISINGVIQWFRSHTAFSHKIAATAVAIWTAYFTVPVFHDTVNSIYNAFPPKIKGPIASGVALGVALYGLYMRTHKHPAPVEPVK